MPSSRRHLLVGALALTASLGYVAQRGSSFRRHLRAATAAAAGPAAVAELELEHEPRRLWGLPEVHVPEVHVPEVHVPGTGGGKGGEKEEEEHATDDHGAAHGDDHGAHGDDHGGLCAESGSRSKTVLRRVLLQSRPALPPPPAEPNHRAFRTAPGAATGGHGGHAGHAHPTVFSMGPHADLSLIGLFMVSEWVAMGGWESTSK